MHLRSLMALRLLGNVHLTSGPLHATIGGFPTRLLLALAANADVRLRTAGELPPERLRQLCDRCFSSDVAELFFAVLNSRLGVNFDPATALGCFVILDCLAALAAMTVEQRGFPMQAASKSNACRSAAADPSSWNNGGALTGDVRLGRPYFVCMVGRALCKAGSTQQLAVRQYYKNKR